MTSLFLAYEFIIILMLLFKPNTIILLQSLIACEAALVLSVQKLLNTVTAQYIFYYNISNVRIEPENISSEEGKSIISENLPLQNNTNNINKLLKNLKITNLKKIVIANLNINSIANKFDNIYS